MVHVTQKLIDDGVAKATTALRSHSFTLENMEQIIGIVGEVAISILTNKQYVYVIELANAILRELLKHHVPDAQSRDVFHTKVEELILSVIKKPPSFLNCCYFCKPR
jgi:hypothetical protein